MRSCFGHVNEQHDKAYLSTMFLFRRRNYAPLTQTCTVGELAPNSSARAGFSVSTVRRSIMLVRDSNFFQEAESKSRILGGLHSNRTRGRKARREGGGNQDNPRDEKLIRSVPEYDESPVKRRGFDKAGRRTTHSMPEGDIWMLPLRRPTPSFG